MAGKQNLPSASDALRELGNYLVQCILFRCSMVDFFLLLIQRYFGVNLPMFFFSIKSRAKKRKTSSIELVLQKVNGRLPLDLRNLQDIFQTLQQQRLRLS